MSEPYWAALGGGSVDYKGAWAAGTAYAPGDVVRHNGVDFIAVNPSTGVDPGVATGVAVGFGIALPTSPVDGQEYILVDSLTAPTYSWRFRYVAAKATNKWVFIGGSMLAGEFTGQGQMPGSYGDIAGGPSVVIPVAGVYVIGIGCRVTIWTPSERWMSFALGAATALDADGIVWESTGSPGAAGQDGGTLARRGMQRTLAAGTLATKYRGSGTVYASNRWIEAVPVAVGG